MTHPTGIWHTSELTSSCPRQAYLRLSGQRIAVCESAMFVGLAAGHALQFVHEADEWDTEKAAAIALDAVDKTFAELQAEGRVPSAAVVENRKKNTAKVGDTVKQYQTRFAAYFAECELLGCEVPCRYVLDVDGEAVPFESHIDLLFRGPDVTGGDHYVRFWDWKFHDDAPTFAYLHRNLQFALYHACIGRGEVMLDGFTGWEVIGEWPLGYWCDLARLKPYGRKVVVTEGDQKVEYKKGDARPLHKIVLDAPHNKPDVIDEALRSRVRMARDGHWPAIPDKVGCSLCDVSGACPAFGGMR